MTDMTPEQLMTSVDEQMPEFGVPVIGYNREWINEDFNHRGLRECFIYGDGTQWHTAKWNDGPDCYETTDDDKPTHWSPMLNSAALSANGGEVRLAAWAVFANNNNIRIWGKEKPEAFPEAVPLYLSQTAKESLTTESTGKPVGYTGSGSLDALKQGAEGHIFPSPAAAHPVPLYTHPAPPAVNDSFTTESVNGGEAVPDGFTRLAFNRANSEWLYLNHAGTWQTCPCPTPPSVAVPDGWKLVPIEPTEDMVLQGFESDIDPEFNGAFDDLSGCQEAALKARLCYAAMLTAAPPSVAVPEGWKTKVLELCSAVENDGDLPPIKYALKCGRLINEVKAMIAAAPPPATQNVEWFFYDAENGHIELCETKEEALSKAQKAVDFCFDECWSDEVEQICVGTITHRAKQTDLMFKPQKLDEDMFSEDGEHWPEDCESKCDYSIEPIDPQPQGGGE